MSLALLELKDVVAGYGPAVALHEINLSLQAGQRVSLLGANGAGKSSIVNVISGLLPIRSGEVWFEGERIDGRPAHRVVELGIAQIPEGRLIFPKMSVWENLELGSTALRDKEQKDGLLEQVFELFPRLAERRKQLAGTMSGGEQQMLAVGRALMSRPRLILSDEISMGLAPVGGARHLRHLAAASTRSGGSPCSWSSRRPSWPWKWPIPATCWNRVASRPRGPPKKCLKASWCARCIWLRTRPSPSIDMVRVCKGVSDMTEAKSSVFSRRLGQPLPVAVSGDGVWIFDADGNRYLDASGGAVVVNLGHGRKEIAQAVADQMAKLYYAHPTMFTSPPAEELALALAAHTPGDLNRFYFMTSGSEANETAIKLARQIHQARGSHDKSVLISRWRSYHGLTMGALAAAGRPAFRTPYMPLIHDAVHIPPPYCLRCSYGLEHPGCGLRCALALDETIQNLGPRWYRRLSSSRSAGPLWPATLPLKATSTW